MRRMLSLLLPLLMTGCGTHATPLTAAPAMSTAAAKAALGRPFIDPETPVASVCKPNVPAPRPPRPPFSATRADADALVVSCVQLNGFHNFGGTGTTAIVAGTRGGQPTVIRLTRMNDFEGGESHDAAIDGQRKPVAEVAALLAAAPATPQFPESTRALVLALLK